MARIKMHIPKAKLPFYPSYEVKCRLQNGVSTAANFNSRTLNALFNAVTNEEFKKISSINKAKEAQTILQNTNEGTKAVKNFMVQRLTTSFKEIRMDEDESFDELYAKLKDIVNSAFNPQISSREIPCKDHCH